MTKDELIAKYPDAGWRDRLLRLTDYTEFLEESILSTSYRIPDDLNKAIRLTAFGLKIRDALVTKEKVPAKEANVLCLLRMLHNELLVDVEQTQLEKIHTAIHKDILSGHLKYPFIFGGGLYDRASELFADERRLLSYDDTGRLLEGLPVGVFQSRFLLSGPYGLLESRQQRFMRPEVIVPFYHCSELTCSAVHRCRLTSDMHNPVNEHRDKIDKLLDAESDEPPAWGEFLAEISGVKHIVYDDKNASSILVLLGDALSVPELRMLLEHLLDNTNGRVRTDVEPLGITGKAAKAVDSLDRAQLMQLTLMALDEEIVSSLDELVETEKISVPIGEVRKPVVNRASRWGRFGLQPQLSTYGVRFHATADQLGPLRLRRLVDRLYLLDQDSDVAELEWQLRGVQAPTLPARLEEFVRTSTPEHVLRQLVLARRTNMIAACTELGIDEHRVRSDDYLISTLLWKLGFEIRDKRDPNSRFWQLHDRMKQVTQTAAVSAIVDAEAVRALASNYFVLLEGVLDDSLAFATWALTTDHMTTNQPFVYNVNSDRGKAFEVLNMASAEIDSRAEPVEFAEKNSLYVLCRGFGILGQLLSRFKSGDISEQRRPADLPEYVKYSSIKTFPFRHKRPFLDLLDGSQDRIIKALEEVSHALAVANVNEVRNDQLHFRRSSSDLERLSSCLADVESAVRLLERDGFVRIPFHPARSQGDEWDRNIFVMTDPRGLEIAFARPSAYDRLRLPGLRSTQYLMTSAVFAEPHEILRFTNRLDSEYARMWDGYPKPRQASLTGGSLSADVGGATGNVSAGVSLTI